MTKAAFATDEFPWQDMGGDDYKCKVDETNLLRVEKMDDGLWWWTLYRVDESENIMYAHIMASSKYRAIGLCEGVYLGRKYWGALD